MIWNFIFPRIQTAAATVPEFGNVVSAAKTGMGMRGNRAGNVRTRSEGERAAANDFIPQLHTRKGR